MASNWILQALYASLISQAIPPSNQPPTKVPSTSDAPSYRPLVHTAYGDLQGVQTRTSSNVLIDKFLGIPYATPPVGKLRLNKPIPTTKWNGVRDASNFESECFQRFIPDYHFQITDEPLARTEDCLYLNVYRPVTSSSDLIPVMVWIHGGAYYLGAGSQYEASDLSENGVIVVTINYRLDVFGFLSNDDDVIPGNYGMLDQVMALKWIKSNIKSFQGDPDKITIFGESAGAGSVSLLMLSPLAKGLFNRAIMESGTSLCSWAMHHPAARISSKTVVNLLGSKVGCDERDAVKKLDCLRKVDAETLLNASIQLEVVLESGTILLPPVVETTFGFLPELPIQLLSRGDFNHVDTIIGFNAAESGLNVLQAGFNYSMTPQNFIDTVKGLNLAYYIVDIDRLSQEMLQTYVGNERDGHKILLKAVDYLSDFFFKGGGLLEASISSKMAPEKNHFVYEFNQKPSLSKVPSWMPPIHGEEISFVFGAGLKQFQVEGLSPSSDDFMVSKTMQTLWANFAKYGNPRSSTSAGPQWDGYDSDTKKVLRISRDSQQVSFKNHLANSMFPKILEKLDNVKQDEFIVG